MKLAVGFYPYRRGIASGNLKWAGKWPMKRGYFPKGHPAAGNGSSDDAMQHGTSPELLAFRARGYWASCFPEGDGITWQPLNGQDDDQALADVRACWPEWRVIERGEFQPLLEQFEREEATRERNARRAFVEAKERARTGLCSHIIKYGVYCSLQPGHAGKHSYAPPPPPPKPEPRRCCPRCGEWLASTTCDCRSAVTA